MCVDEMWVHVYVHRMTGVGGRPEIIIEGNSGEFDTGEWKVCVTELALISVVNPPTHSMLFLAYKIYA